MGRRLLPGVAAALVSVLVVLVGPAVLADDEVPALSIRRVDATDPASVQVSLIWRGERAALSGLTVREDGQQRRFTPPVPLTQAGIERAMVVAVDTSRSMGENGGLAATQTSLRRLVDEMQGGEVMGLVSFGTEVRVLSTLTRDKDQLRRAIDALRAPIEAKTALWDGVRKAASLFDPASALQPNLVVVTDGFEDASTSTEADARAALTHSKAAVFALGYGAQQTLDENALRGLVQHAGGGVIAAPGPGDLEAALVEVERALAEQYVITFASAAEQGATDLELSLAGESHRTTFVSGAVSEGQANLTPPTVSRSSFPRFLRGQVGMVVAIGAGGLAVALAVFALGMVLAKDDDRLDTMLQQYTDPSSSPYDAQDSSLAQTAFVQRAVHLTEEIAQRQGVLVKVETKLEMADLPLRAAEALFFYLAGGFVISLLGLALMGMTGLLALGLFAFLVPPAVLNYLAAQRQKRFDAQLPDMLQLLSGSLRAGYSLVQGVDAVATEMDGPMGRELRRIMTEARLGRELEDAFETAAARVQSKDFEWAIMAIRIQREVGGNLSELLLTVAETMISRERLRRDVAALTAEGKISAIVLGIMPPGLGVFMYMSNPTYMESLFTETLGQLMLGGGVVSALIGFAWMKKCITIEI